MRVNPVLQNSYGTMPIDGNNKKNQPSFGAVVKYLRVNHAAYPKDMQPKLASVHELISLMRKQYKKIGDDTWQLTFWEDFRNSNTFKVNAQIFAEKKDIPSIVERCKHLMRKQDVQFYEKNITEAQTRLATEQCVDEFLPPAFDIFAEKGITAEKYVQQQIKGVNLDTPAGLRNMENEIAAKLLDRTDSIDRFLQGVKEWFTTTERFTDPLF